MNNYPREETLCAHLARAITCWPCRTPSSAVFAPRPPWRSHRPASARSTSRTRPRSQQDTNLKPHPTPPTPAAADKLPVDKIKLPAGFKAEVWSSGHPGARTMVQGAKGTVFMGTRVIGRVYAITEKDGKREAKVLLQGLTQPNGLAFKDGALYVFAINKVFRYDNIEDKLDNPGQAGRTDRQVRSARHDPPQLEVRRLRTGRKALCAGRRELQHLRAQPRHPRRRSAATTRTAPAWRSSRAACATRSASTGIRSPGSCGSPTTAATGPATTVPQDELNRIAKGQEGANYGFPYCHANGVPDPDMQAARMPAPASCCRPRCSGPHCRRARHQVLHRQHVPGGIPNVAFVVRRGSWNRSQKFGYDVVVAKTQPDGTATIEPFLTGLLDEAKNEFHGRPTYVLQMQDGSLLVSDEQNGATYRISLRAARGPRRRGRKARRDRHRA